MQLGNFIRNFMEYDSSNLGKEYHNFMRIRVHIDIWHPLKRKKQEGEGELAGNCEGNRVPGNSLWDLGKKVGKGKRGLGETEELTAREEINTLAVRNRRMLEINHLSLAATKRQADMAQ
ncbi:hypothetical protein Golax_005050 [Gossypium laxum]|uniref:Uncharacterized protein n=1 Tax=Gossypium laxum TaxID=34288 RepID=A0A7J8ZZJ4_9ROSI|nr:hypothetical protein [Gossypium laxum]